LSDDGPRRYHRGESGHRGHANARNCPTKDLAKATPLKLARFLNRSFGLRVLLGHPFACCGPPRIGTRSEVVYTSDDKLSTDFGKADCFEERAVLV